MTQAGAVWYKVAVDDKSALGTALSAANDHYIKFTAPYDGTVAFTASIDSLHSKYTASLKIKAAEVASDCGNSGDANVNLTAVGTNFVLSHNVTAGTTYYVWAYSWNAGAGGYSPYITISSITYTHASDLTTLTLANDSEAGEVFVNGVAGVTSCNVQKGEYVKLSVAPNAGSIFGGWKNSSDEIVSEDSEIWVLAEDAISLTTTWRTADVHNFVWNPAVASGNWNDSANWLYEGVAPAATYPSDASSDVVTFNSAATVNFTEAAFASNVTFNAAVTLAGAKGLTAKMIAGEGVLTLDSFTLANISGTSLVVSNDIAVVGTSTNYFNAYSSTIELRGDISGSAPLKFTLNDNGNSRVLLYGNNNGYTGEGLVVGGRTDARRSVFGFWNQYAAGTNAFWTVNYNACSYNKADYVMAKQTTYIGGYSGEFSDKENNRHLYIGYLNRDSDITLINPNSRLFDITKVGTANLTIANTLVRNLTINGGSVTMPLGIAPNTLTIAEGAKIILAGDSEWAVDTVTNLFSYTTLAGTGAAMLASQIELTGLAANLGAEFTVDTENKTVSATIVKKATPEPSTVPVFLTGGQSNTEGRIPNSDLPAYLANNELALVSNHSTVSDSTELGTFSAWAPSDKWAYDTEVYYQLAQALGTEFYVVKTSYGGTSVNPSVNNSPSSHDNAWLPGYGAGYHWSADADFLAATVSAGRTFVTNDVTYDGQSMLKAWIENIDAALDALIADNKTPEVKAIIWHQGESDNNNGNYADNLTEMVNYVRQHLATKLSNDDYLDLPFFCGNVPRKSSLFKVNLDNQFKTIEETENNNMHVVDIYDLTMLSDNKHFDAASAITFGKRLYNRMIDEGVIEGDTVEVAPCVRSPDFGVEQVINNTTTWTWNEMSGDIATALTNIDGIYFHAGSGNSRKVQIYNHSETLNWTIGDTTPTVVSKGAYCTAYANSSSSISQTSTAGDNNAGSYMVAMNAGRAGKFEVFYWAREGCTVRMYLNGQVVDSHEASDGELVRLYGENTAKSVYYLGFGKGAIMGARFVPTEEMPTVQITIGADGYGTFGNLYESSFVLPEGVKAYAISPVEGYSTLLSMTEVGALNLGDAVVVSGPAGTYD
ncbi:MAG: hypothetical protein J6W80_06735, partial [Kiritimatiellae bacterium]|nr:hypothetical protein [Kiritimatiellia bacterium]